MNEALENLKKLVFKGYLTKEVEIDGVKIKLRTLTLQEELSVLDECNLTGVPETPKDMLKYIPTVLKYSIFMINGEKVNKEDVGQLLNNSSNPGLLTRLYNAYLELERERGEAGAELKNS